MLHRNLYRLLKSQPACIEAPNVAVTAGADYAFRVGDCAIAWDAGPGPDAAVRAVIAHYNLADPSLLWHSSHSNHVLRIVCELLSLSSERGPYIACLRPDIKSKINTPGLFLANGMKDTFSPIPLSEDELLLVRQMLQDTTEGQPGFWDWLEEHGHIDRAIEKVKRKE